MSHTSHLRACDLVPKRVYLSPSGRRCMLLEPQAQGIANVAYLFAYLKPDGTPYADETFSLSMANEYSIAALREVGA